MERNRETRRVSILGSNGFNRRRQRAKIQYGGVELQESVRLRDRVKKDRYLEREREIDVRERHSRSKRRRGNDETSEESINDDEDYEDEENTAAAAAVVRLLSPTAVSVSNHHHYSHNITNNHHLQHRKSFPLGFSSSSSSSSKAFRPSPVWKPGDEIISVYVPRKARTASTKRSRDWISRSSNNINGGGAEQILRQASSSPARQSGGVSKPFPSPAAPMSSKQNSSNPKELEIEIAEALFGLMTQSQSPSSSSSKNEDSKEVNRSTGNGKSSPISNSGPLQAVAPKRKRPRQVVENSGHGARPDPVSVKVEMGQSPKSEISSPNLDKISGSTGENEFEVGGNLVNTQGQPAAQPPELKESRDLVIKEDMKEKESCAVKNEDNFYNDSVSGNSMVPEVEIQREQKFEIDLMESKPVVSEDKEEHEEAEESAKEQSANLAAEVRESKGRCEETESKTEIENNLRNIDLQLDLEKAERNENAGNKLQQQLTVKSGQSKSFANLPSPIASWPDGLPLPPMRYMAPLQGVIPMDGTTVTPSPIQPLFTQPRPKRCATHCYIARNIHCLQQFMKVNPFLQASADPTSLCVSESCKLNTVPSDPVGNVAGGGLNNGEDEGQGVASSPNYGGKGSQNASSLDTAQRKQQILIQPALPSVGHSNLLGLAFIFPLNQEKAAAAAAASARPSPAKSPPITANGGTSSSNPSSFAGENSLVAAAATTMSFNYRPMAAANEVQYLAILQNSSYPFPIPAVGPLSQNYRGQAMPLFISSFSPSQMIHPSQIHHQKTPSPQPSPKASTSNDSSSSQKNLPTQQQPRPQSNCGPGSANLQNYSTQKSQPSNIQHGQHPIRPIRLESEPGREDSPMMTTDSSRESRAPLRNIYGPNFTMPIHPQQPLQPFEMSFGIVNGTNAIPGNDITSMAQNRAIFQSFPEATRQNIQMMAAATAQAAQKNNYFRISGDNRSGNGDSSTKMLNEKNWLQMTSDNNQLRL